MAKKKTEQETTEVALHRAMTARHGNALARSAYDMSTSQRRIMEAMLKALEIIEDKEMTVFMKMSDVVLALDLSKSARMTHLLENAADSMLDLHVTIEEENGWKKYPWFDEMGYTRDTKTFKFCFNRKLRGFISDYKKEFYSLELSNLGKLQSKYAQRIYELALSWKGEMGKHGNKPGEWFVAPIPIEQIRFLFEVGSKYSKTAKLRLDVIDGPCEEINEAGVGIYIEPEYIRPRGNIITAVKFLCREATSDTPKPAHKETPEEAESRVLIDDYPDLYEQVRKEVKAEGELFPETRKPFEVELEIQKRFHEAVEKIKKKKK